MQHLRRMDLKTGDLPIFHALKVMKTKFVLHVEAGPLV